MDLQRERELVERARTDADAFGELYDEHYGRIFGYVLRRTASVDAAQDVTSDVFFKALSNLHRFRWRDVPFSAWLYRIAGNEIANRHRRDNRDRKHVRETMAAASAESVATGEEVHRPEAELIRHEEFLELHASIALLPVALLRGQADQGDMSNTGQERGDGEVPVAPRSGTPAKIHGVKCNLPAWFRVMPL
jgi:RNA polymerase sigma factor (sigma-70 family)